MSVHTQYEEIVEHYRRQEANRRKRFLLKVLLSIMCVISIGVSIWALVHMNEFIKTVSTTVIGDMELDHNQSVDDAQWWSFGPRLEKFWRALLLVSLILTIITAVLACIGVFFDQYYLLVVFVAIHLIESILALGSQYLRLPGHVAWITFFLAGAIGHIYLHYLRQDLIDDFIARVFEAKQKRRLAQENDEMYQDNLSNILTKPLLQRTQSPRTGRVG